MRTKQAALDSAKSRLDNAYALEQQGRWGEAADAYVDAAATFVEAREPGEAEAARLRSRTCRVASA